MLAIIVSVSWSMLTMYMNARVTLPVTMVTLMIISVIIVNKVVLQVFAVEIGA